jgi:hypothetical protein
MSLFQEKIFGAVDRQKGVDLAKAGFMIYSFE